MDIKKRFHNEGVFFYIYFFNTILHSLSQLKKNVKKRIYQIATFIKSVSKKIYLCNFN